MIEPKNHNDIYKVDEVIRTTSNGWTEKVIEPSGQLLLRKYINESSVDLNMCEMLSKLDNNAFPKLIDQYDFEGFYVLVSEYIHGLTLSEIIESLGSVNLQSAIDWTIMICEALNYLHNAHQTPIIHRDIKPENIMFQKGVIKVIDFGIARTYKPENNRDTVYMGTLGYAAPEQFGFGQTDVRTDIYSIGMTLRFLLTGVHPVNDKKGKNMDLPVEIREIVNKCTEFDPNLRYSNVKELIESLRIVKNDLQNIKTKSKIDIKMILLHCLMAIISFGIFKNAFEINSGFGNWDDFLLQAKQISIIFIIFLPSYFVGFNVLNLSDYLSHIAFLRNNKRLQIVFTIILAFLFEALLTVILNQFHTPDFIKSLQFN